jgi:(3,5-dihydroxyphenyl)acetyl-CoA 1,2-dioxygenase
MAAVTTTQPDALIAAGLPRDEVERWQAGHFAGPRLEVAKPDALAGYAQAAEHFWANGEALLRRLPPKPRRDEREQAAVETLLASLRESRTCFLRAYAHALYGRLTDEYQSLVPAEELVYAAAERYPGLTPTRAAVLGERELQQKDKDGVEVDQGLFLSQVLAHPRAGAHLVHAMLRPRPESLERLDDFRQRGVADLGTAYLRREGKAGLIELRNPRFLNAEDDSTTEPLETAVDLVLLDPAIEVGVLRGGYVEHPKYQGRRIFNAGINLTHLYHGQISFLFYITRDMGFVNKIYRGLSPPEFWPGEPEATQEKPFIAAVEAFAIGGGCQLLLVMDHVLAEAGSFFNLPARKEGIIPGAANLRLTRFVGDRLARQGILFERQFPAESPAGRLLCDGVVPPGEMDAAIARTIATLTSSGVVSAAGNRKALRVGQEPIGQFQAYMATYAREQAYCHFSPALIRNLEDNWNAHERTL